MKYSVPNTLTIVVVLYDRVNLIYSVSGVHITNFLVMFRTEGNVTVGKIVSVSCGIRYAKWR